MEVDFCDEVAGIMFGTNALGLIKRAQYAPDH
jgi:hypothetical protein